MINYLKTALRSIWGNKARSLLTVLGIVIGVASVTSLVALGQGLQYDVANIIRGLGTNVLVVIGGQVPEGNMNGSQGQTNPMNLFAGDILTIADVNTVAENPEVVAVSPMSLVSAKKMSVAEQSSSPMIMGVYPNFMEISQVISVAEGDMFTNETDNQVVIGHVLKEYFFGDNPALNETILIGDEEFTVIGILEEPSTTSMFGSEFGSVAVIPYEISKKLNADNDKIFRIMIKTEDDADVHSVKEQLTEKLKENHDGEEYFTVFTQEDILSVFNQFLGMATAMVSAIAAISLIVGGIGIMNIMLVSVTERTKEIGIRKAVGASQVNILIQFLTESIIITLLGGAIGLGLSFIAVIFISAYTPIQPLITWSVILLALGISVTIGIIFGIWPAFNAARKDPIEALRHE